jgi:hypothetical protein
MKETKKTAIELAGNVLAARLAVDMAKSGRRHADGTVVFSKVEVDCLDLAIERIAGALKLWSPGELKAR